MTKLPGAHAVDRPIMRPGDGEDDWVLVGSRCPTDGTTYFPPRNLCPKHMDECEEIELSHEGTIYQAVDVHVAPMGFEAPYWVAYVDLPEGVRIFVPLAWDAERPPAHGDPVRYLVEPVRRDGDEEIIGPVFHGPLD